MPKFKYTGESPNGSFEMYGVTWEHGSVAEVADNNFANKLRGNRFFEEVNSTSEVAQDAAVEPGSEPSPRKSKKSKKDVGHGDAEPTAAE